MNDRQTDIALPRQLSFVLNILAQMMNKEMVISCSAAVLFDHSFFYRFISCFRVSSPLRAEAVLLDMWLKLSAPQFYVHSLFFCFLGLQVNILCIFWPELFAFDERFEPYFTNCFSIRSRAVFFSALSQYDLV